MFTSVRAIQSRRWRLLADGSDVASAELNPALLLLPLNEAACLAYRPAFSGHVENEVGVDAL